MQGRRQHPDLLSGRERLAVFVSLEIAMAFDLVSHERWTRFGRADLSTSTPLSPTLTEYFMFKMHFTFLQKKN